jgi:hypothetical protein
MLGVGMAAVAGEVVEGREESAEPRWGGARGGNLGWHHQGGGWARREPWPTGVSSES